jgi:hypothetical protein
MSSQITSAAIGILLAGAILYLVRRDHLHGTYALWWLAIAGVILLLGVFPPVIDWLGRVSGISYPPVLPIIVGIGMILIRMLRMDIDRSRQERQLRRLAQKLAILEQELVAARREAAAAAAPSSTPARGPSAQVIPLPKSSDA